MHRRRPAYRAVPMPRFRLPVRESPPDAIAQRNRSPTNTVADLAITRHTSGLIQRRLLKLGIRRHQRQTVRLANSVENRGGIIVSGSQRHVQWHCRYRQRPTDQDQNHVG